MANQDRRAVTGKRGRRLEDPVEVDYNGLWPNISGEMEDVSVDGIPVSKPASFGSDGDEHRLGILAVSPVGSVTAFRH